MTVSNEHKQVLAEMRKRLVVIGNKECDFISVELLFYDAIRIARFYGDDPATNSFLSDLKNLEISEYEESRQLFRKSSQREKVIRRFSMRLKTILSNYSKTPSLRQQAG
ncbi:MAG TPA: hypothetical protein VFZ78_10410 [Flavisolibacter sp.]